MAAGTADIIKEALYRFTSVRSPETVIAHRDDQVAAEFARYCDPLDALELQAEIGQLNDQIIALDWPQMKHDEAVADHEPLHRLR